jgi:hypothetical protein
MNNPGSELISFFLNYFPRKYLEQVLRALFDCYEAAYEHCETHFEPPEAANVLPFVRRAMIEAQLREIAQLFPNMTAAARQSPESAWYHTLVMCGRIALTESTVGHPDEVVRPSLFRQQYSSRDNIKYLLPEMEPEAPTPDSVLYGILLHGKSHEGAHKLGFAKIRFPKENVEGYQPGIIDLFLEFPQIVVARTQRSASSEAAVVQIPEPVVELRTDQQKAEGDA